MLKIHQLFLRTYLTIFLAILLSLTLTTYFWAKNLYTHQIEKNLLQSIDIIELTLKDAKDLQSLSSLVKELSSKINLRISIIDEEGEVIAESHKELQNLSNHLNRIEIIEAKNIGVGKDIRVSETLAKDLLYIAKKIQLNEKTFYIRLADYVNKITDNFMKLTIEIFIYIFFFLILAFLSTYFISLKIKKETDLILKFLRDLTKKKTPIFLSSNYTFEFYKIAKLLNKVSSKLAKKEKEKAKHTAKLTISNRQKDDIISAISHEFKNPIAIISGYSQTMLEDTNLPKETKEKFLYKILTNSNKMSNIIDKLRLSLKLQEEKQELVLNAVFIKKLIENSISDLKIKYKNREIKIVGKDKLLQVDETLISMAISNLIENALKYSKDEIIIDISSKQIAIIDKGIGISKDELEKIRKKFYRVSNNDWNNSLGLGLFIVQAILKLHKFKLEIESKLNKGSKFIIYH